MRENEWDCGWVSKRARVPESKNKYFIIKQRMYDVSKENGRETLVWHYKNCTILKAVRRDEPRELNFNNTTESRSMRPMRPGRWDGTGRTGNGKPTVET